jgi:RimJ/RimL family protein N-acetyltransferase
VITVLLLPKKTKKKVANLKMALTHLFRSERLIYRAMEGSAEEKALYQEVLMNDSASYAQSTNLLLKPLTRAEIDKMYTGSGNSLLNVALYLADENVPIHLKKEDEPNKAADKDEITVPKVADNSVQKNSGEKLVGWIGLDSHPQSRHHGSCTLGITIATAYQGKGYGTEAINWALDWAFQVARMHAVRLVCFSFNEGAIRLYEKIGFVKEGLNRQAYYYNRQWHDRIFYSILDTEWEALRGLIPGNAT